MKGFGGCERLHSGGEWAVFRSNPRSRWLLPIRRLGRREMEMGILGLIRYCSHC